MSLSFIFDCNTGVMSNLSSSYSDTDEKVYLSQLTPTFGISANDRRNAQEHINMLWKMNQCILLYLSSGAGRGLELTRVHPKVGAKIWT